MAQPKFPSWELQDQEDHLLPHPAALLQELTSITWQKAPKTIAGARAKLKALEDLLLEPEEDQTNGGV